MFYPAPPRVYASEREGSWGSVGNVGVKGLAGRPTGNLAIRAGAALAAVAGTGAGPWDQVLTVPTAGLDSILSACAPLGPQRPAFCGWWVGTRLTAPAPSGGDWRAPWCSLAGAGCTQYLGRPAWHTVPPPCAALGRCPRLGRARGWCRTGCVDSGHHRRRLSMGTRRSSRTRRPALQGDRCVRGAAGAGRAPRQSSVPSQARPLLPWATQTSTPAPPRLPQLTARRGPSLSGVAGRKAGWRRGTGSGGAGKRGPSGARSSKTNSKQSPHPANPLEEREK